MVSNFSRLWLGHLTKSRLAPRLHRLRGLGERVLDRIREAFCGLHGHDSLLQFQQDRMFLKCVSCGHESPGWSLNGTPPPVRSAGTKRVATGA